MWWGFTEYFSWCTILLAWGLYVQLVEAFNARLKVQLAANTGKPKLPLPTPVSIVSRKHLFDAILYYCLYYSYHADYQGRQSCSTGVCELHLSQWQRHASGTASPNDGCYGECFELAIATSTITIRVFVTLLTLPP